MWKKESGYLLSFFVVGLGADMCETKVVNLYKESYDIYIGRGSKWGNPYSHMKNTLAKYKVTSREEAIEAYRDYIVNGEGRWLLLYLEELRGKRLGCFCKPKSCHGDVLVELLEMLYG